MSDSSELTRAVEAAEAACGAEVVVVGYRRADGYGDVVFRTALLGTIAALAATLFLPVEIEHDFAFPLIVGVTVFVLALLRWSRVLAVLTSKARQKQAVDLIVAHTFLQRGVHKTGKRIGMLVMWFEFEQTVRVVFDTGIEHVVPGHVRTQLTSTLHQQLVKPEQRAAAIAAIGTTLAPFLPHDNSSGNELGDAVSQAGAA
jgi:uncharacterized membrane protein